MGCRNLVVVLGDQLGRQSAALDGFDPLQDLVWMAEVDHESTKVWTSKIRIALFLSSMRHFRDDLRALGIQVDYRELDDPGEETLGGQLRQSLAKLRPQRVILTEPGEWSVAREVEDAARAAAIPTETRIDRHFLCNREEFAAHAQGRKQLRMEFFYREMRQRTGYLMEAAKPVGGRWNFDEENRKSFDRSGPPQVWPVRKFLPDALTQAVIDLVERRFAKHPGSLADFDWPVTPEQAREALDDFLTHRLPYFGRYQDAMWQNEPWLFHSRTSAALNLKLLDPRDVLAGAEAAYRSGQADLASVEGFIRQILGWREYVRGIYWLYMPEYIERNAMGAQEPLPEFYWTGDTEMNCLRDALTQTLRFGYAHHIQRLMVTGLFSLLLGVHPRRVHEWYLAVYVDAVEWVELPNTLGMSQYADGGVMASKPYVASGKYIQRMSNYCTGCRYDPAQSTGPKACPFTTLYWDYLLRYERELTGNPRMTMQLRNLSRLVPEHREQIHQQSTRLRSSLAAGERV